jgi:hypothetical protein
MKKIIILNLTRKDKYLKRLFVFLMIFVYTSNMSSFSQITTNELPISVQKKAVINISANRLSVVSLRDTKGTVPFVRFQNVYSGNWGWRGVIRDGRRRGLDISFTAVPA